MRRKLNIRHRIKKQYSSLYNTAMKFLFRQTVVFVGTNMIYKFLYSKAAKTIRREFVAAKRTRKNNSVWKGKGVFFSPLVRLGAVGMVCSAPRLARKATNKQVDRAIQDLINNVPQNTEKRPWYETLDEYQLNIVMSSLKDDHRDFIIHNLDNVYLPITCAHGDLVDRHFFLTDNGEIKLIDWEFFREKGSVVTDVLRCYMFRFSKSYRYDQHNPRLLKEVGLPVRLPEYYFPANKETPDLDQLSVLGAITNTCIPVPDLLLKKRIKRFSTYLNQYAKNKHLRRHPHPQPPRWPGSSD